GQRISPSRAAPTPPASTPAAGQLQTPSRLQRGATTTPLGRRAAGRARPLGRSRGDASEPAPRASGASTAATSSAASHDRGADVYPLAGAKPASDALSLDALPADRILELSVRRGSSTRQPSTAAAAGGSSAAAPLRPAVLAGDTTERRVAPLTRRAG